MSSFPSNQDRVSGYLSGPMAVVRRRCERRGARLDGARFRVDGREAQSRADGVLYYSTDPTEALSQDLLITEFANAGDGPVFVPVTTEVPVGATTYSYLQVTDTGEARPYSHQATDIPRVSVETAKFEHPVIPIACAYDWSVDDADTAALAVANGWPVNLPAEKARVANQANARAATKIVFQGIPALGVSGLANEPTVSTAPLPNGSWDNPATTPEQIYEDLVYLVKTVRLSTLGVRAADTIVLGTAAYAIVEGTRMTNSDDLTIKVAIERAFQADNLEVATSAWLDSAEAGLGGTAIAYQRDPDVLRQEIPLVYEELPPQEDGLRITVFTRSKCTGAVVRRPAAVTYGTGVLV